MASSKRERELARMRAQRQAARRAAAEAARKARQRTLALSLAVLAVAGIAIGVFFATQGKDDKTSTLAQPTPTATAAATTTPTATQPPGAGAATCTYDASASPASKKIDGKPTTSNVAKTVKKVTLATDQGTIALSLNGAKAPCTVNSFAYLTAQKYFDGTSCHRLTTSGIYVLQCGDPSGTGSGGPGYQFADENLTGATYPRGTVAMANAGPGTNGSQFFLVYKDTQLPPSYTPFGTITAGLDVLDKVAKAGSTPDGDGKPKLPITIKTATLA